jgi:hypothetical protein
MCPIPATRFNVPNSEIVMQQKLFRSWPESCRSTREALIHKASGAECAICDHLLECAICDKRQGSLSPICYRGPSLASLQAIHRVVAGSRMATGARYQPLTPRLLSSGRMTRIASMARG